MSLLPAQVDTFLKRRTQLTRGDTLIVGVSGGPDSLCLMHILAALHNAFGFALHIAHFDHMLRGEDSAADAAFVEQAAQALMLPVWVEQADVERTARERGENVHHVARMLRYRFFARLAERIGAQAIAVAHTADDQAETVLMHLLRGAGTAGLGGMKPISDMGFWMLDREASETHQRPDTSHAPHLLRPLLATTRAEIEAYCAAHNLRPRYDATNADVYYTRNAIRHTLLPQLRIAAPQITEALNRTAAICADDADFIEHSLDAVWPALAHTDVSSVYFNGSTWHALHSALQRAALRRAYTRLAGADTLTWERVEAARALIEQPGKHVEFPDGVRLVTSHDGATMYALEASLPIREGPQLAAEAQALPVPSSSALECGWMLHTAFCHKPVPQPEQAWEVYLDLQIVPEHLSVRRRQPGDRLRLAQGHGSRRVQDIFVDAKIPRELRARWPLITTPETIVWIPGLRAAAGTTATEATEHAIHIWITPPRVY